MGKKLEITPQMEICIRQDCESGLTVPIVAAVWSVTVADVLRILRKRRTA